MVMIRRHPEKEPKVCRCCGGRLRAAAFLAIPENTLVL
ncbi:hypothetical protein BVRB_4g076210 [Beta vulgaris subsp. vulgaris]|uniref:Uncharacterized protein n=1 Tax=Beta vulgaris subsp. vulgaris TaxID=3555 RepID=A0A0J8CKJ4_BETVV|nr:hypothetical protein BVRB_4g076210 [Beta vulgaris subsp. vulgaris]